MRKLIAEIIFLTTITTTAFAGFDEGLAAYRAKNFASAMREWKAAAEESTTDGAAAYNVGQMYDNGTGVPTDKPAAFQWYLKAAKKGYKNAQQNVGVMFFSGEGTPVNMAESFQWYLKAAQQGHAGAQNEVGAFYMTGFGGIPVDDKEAEKWFRKAIAGGNNIAVTNLQKVLNRVSQKE